MIWLTSAGTQAEPFHWTTWLLAAPLWPMDDKRIPEIAPLMLETGPRTKVPEAQAGSLVWVTMTIRLVPCGDIEGNWVRPRSWGLTGAKGVWTSALERGDKNRVAVRNSASAPVRSSSGLFFIVWGDFDS